MTDNATTAAAEKKNRDFKECEIKLHTHGELASVRARLVALGATLEEAQHFERNTLFDRNNELAAGSRILRVRMAGERVELTYKGPAHYEGEVKIRDEINLSITDADGLLRLLESLGFAPGTRYEKRRETWKLNSTLVCLDQTPIGDFVELEGGDIETVRERLGLSDAIAERRSYLGLYADHRKENPGAPEFMTFEPVLPEGSSE